MVRVSTKVPKEVCRVQVSAGFSGTWEKSASQESIGFSINSHLLSSEQRPLGSGMRECEMLGSLLAMPCKDNKLEGAVLLVYPR